MYQKSVLCDYKVCNILLIFILEVPAWIVYKNILPTPPPEKILGNNIALL